MEESVRKQQIISQLVKISIELLTEQLNCPIDLKLGLDNLKNYLMKFSSIAEVMNRPNVKKPFILKFLPYVLAIICEPASNVYLSRAVLELMITALEGSDIRVTDATVALFELSKLVDLMDMCGDYVLQEMILKFVTQLIDKDEIEIICMQLFPENSELQAKLSGILMTGSNFELESRNFLNFFNLKKSKRVVSIFCKGILFGDLEMCSDVWVDFNEGSRSISFCCKTGLYQSDILTITVWDIEDKKCILRDGLLHFQIHMTNAIFRKTRTGIEETVMPQITFVMEDDYEPVLLHISANFFAEPTVKAIENRKVTKVPKTAVILDQSSRVASDCSDILRTQSEDLPLVPNLNDDNPLMSVESDKFYTPPVYVVASSSASNSSEYLDFSDLDLNVLECSLNLNQCTEVNENDTTSTRRHFMNVVDDISDELEETSEISRKQQRKNAETTLLAKTCEKIQASAEADHSTYRPCEVNSNKHFVSEAGMEDLSASPVVIEILTDTDEELEIVEIADDSDVTPENIIMDEGPNENDIRESVEHDLEAMQDLIKLTGSSAVEKQGSSGVKGEKKTLKKGYPDRDAREKYGTKKKVGNSVKNICYVRIPKNEQEIVLQFISQNTKGIAQERRRETERQVRSEYFVDKDQEFNWPTAASTSKAKKNSVATKIDLNEEFVMVNELHETNIADKHKSNVDTILGKHNTVEVDHNSNYDEQIITVNDKIEKPRKSPRRFKRIRVISDSEESTMSSEKYEIIARTTVTDKNATPSSTQIKLKSPHFKTKKGKVEQGKKKKKGNSSTTNFTNDNGTRSIKIPTASLQPKVSEGPTGMEDKSKTKRKRKLFDPNDTSHLTIMTNDVSRRTANESKVKQCVSDESSQNLEETTLNIESEETTVEKAKRPKIVFESKEQPSQREQLAETSDTVRQTEEEINELEVRVCSSVQVENVELDEISIPLNEDSNETVLFSRSQLMRNISYDGNKSVANESCETVVNEMLVRKNSPLKYPNQQTTNSTDTTKASDGTILNEPSTSIENTVGITEVGEIQFSEDNNQIDEKYRFPSILSEYILDLEKECRKIHARKERREREKALKRNQRNKRKVKRKPARKPKQNTPKVQKPRIPIIQFKTDTYLDNTREISETEVELLTTNEREAETVADAPASISLLSAEAAYLSPASSGAVISDLETSSKNLESCIQNISGLQPICKTPHFNASSVGCSSRPS